MYSFEIGLSRTVLDDTGMPTLRLSPCVGGCYIHPLSSMESVDDIA